MFACLAAQASWFCNMPRDSFFRSRGQAIQGCPLKGAGYFRRSRAADYEGGAGGEVDADEIAELVAVDA